MNYKTFRALIELNKKFYKKYFSEFSKTRTYNWKGVEKVLTYINRGTKPNMLDLACGNGRLINLFEKEFGNNLSYQGVDNNINFINSCKKAYPNYQFLNLDVLSENFNGSINKFDVIFVLGFLHHVPSKEFRLKWLKNVVKLLSNNGLFVFTIWKLNNDEKYSAKLLDRNSIEVKNNNIIGEDLENNDMFLGWNKSTEFLRYVHLFNDSELQFLVDELESVGLTLLDRYLADGKSDRLNEYFVFEKGS